MRTRRALLLGAAVGLFAVGPAMAVAQEPGRRMQQQQQTMQMQQMMQHMNQAMERVAAVSIMRPAIITAWKIRLVIQPIIRPMASSLSIRPRKGNRVAGIGLPRAS